MSARLGEALARAHALSRRARRRLDLAGLLVGLAAGGLLAGTLSTTWGLALLVAGFALPVGLRPWERALAGAARMPGAALAAGGLVLLATGLAAAARGEGDGGRLAFSAGLSALGAWLRFDAGPPADLVFGSSGAARVPAAHPPTSHPFQKKHPYRPFWRRGFSP